MNFLKLFFVRQFYYFKLLKWASKFSKSYLQKNKYKKKNTILIELYPFYPTHINYLYFCNFLSKKHGARIISYSPHLYNFLNKIFKTFFLLPHYFIHKSFGSEKLILPKFINLKKNNIEKIMYNRLKKIKNKKDLLNFKIDKILLGDLIYDDYLTFYKKPTIDINSLEFRNHFVSGIHLYYFWKDYFKKNRVKSIIVSHNVYSLAIPLRISLMKNIDSFTVGPTFAFRLTKTNYLKNFECYYFKDEFKKYPNYKKIKFIKEAKKILINKFKGGETIDKLVNAPAEHQFIGKKLKISNKSKNKTKVLVALHSFDDSPHCFGNFLFNDFYDWVEFLGKKTNQLDYEWYLKIHPSQYYANIDTINEFVNKFPKFKLLPKNVNHNQLISAGINCVLTVYGTIGFEYAYWGIPVINASKCFPGASYNFNYSPSNLKEYNNLLSKIPVLKKHADKNEIFQYYFMRYLDSFIFWKEFDKVWTELRKYNLGKFSGHNDTLIYKYWLNRLYKKRNSYLLSSIENFYNSKDFKMTRKHSGNKNYKDFIWKEQNLI